MGAGQSIKKPTSSNLFPQANRPAPQVAEAKTQSVSSTTHAHKQEKDELAEFINEDEIEIQKALLESINIKRLTDREMQSIETYEKIMADRELEEAEIQYAIALSLHQQKNDAVKAQAISLEDEEFTNESFRHTRDEAPFFESTDLDKELKSSPKTNTQDQTNHTLQSNKKVQSSVPKLPAIFPKQHINWDVDPIFGNPIDHSKSKECIMRQSDVRLPVFDLQNDSSISLARVVGGLNFDDEEEFEGNQPGLYSPHPPNNIPRPKAAFSPRARGLSGDDLNGRKHRRHQAHTDESPHQHSSMKKAIGEDDMEF